MTNKDNNANPLSRKYEIAAILLKNNTYLKQTKKMALMIILNAYQGKSATKKW